MALHNKYLLAFVWVLNCALLVAASAKAETEPQGCYYIKSYNNRFAYINGDSLALGDDNQKTKFHIAKDGKDFFIRAYDTSRYVSAYQKYGSPDNEGSVGHQPNPMGWEAFSFQEKDNSGKYYIRSEQWKTYLRANAKNIIDQTNIAQEWELFELVKTDCDSSMAVDPQANRCYFIKSYNNRFLHADDMAFKLGDKNEREKFFVGKNGNGFFIRTADGLHISANPKSHTDHDSHGSVRQQPHSQSWETFTFIEKEDTEKFYIKSVPWNTYLRANTSNMLDHTNVAQEWEMFEFLQTECDALPKIVWGFWDKGEKALPAFNKYAVSHWKTLLAPFGYRVRILNFVPGDQNNAISVLGGKSLLSKNFDNLEDVVKSYRLPNGSEVKMVPSVVRSDLVRLAVLEKFGGVWMDTSNVLVRPLENIGIAAFRGSPQTVAGYIMDGYASKDSPVVNGERVDGMENWFIAAKLGSPLIKAWREAFVSYWENRKVGQLIDESPMYRIPKFSFGGMGKDAPNYLNQHAALKLVLFLKPALGQEIYPLKGMQPWWLHGRVGGDAEHLYRGIVSDKMQDYARDIAADHVGLMKFAGPHLTVIKEHFQTVEDYCRTPNLIALIYGHCP